MTEFLACESIAQVQFDERNADRQHRIAQGNARMRERTRIENDEIDPIGGGLVDTLDQLVFGVALKTAQGMAVFLGNRNRAGLDGIQRRRAVNLRFTRAQQVQIRSIEQEKSRHIESMSTRWAKMAAILTLFGDSNARG